MVRMFSPRIISFTFRFPLKALSPISVTGFPRYVASIVTVPDALPPRLIRYSVLPLNSSYTQPVS